MDLIQGTNESGAGLAFATHDIAFLNTSVGFNRTVYEGELVYLSHIGKDGSTGTTSSWTQAPVGYYTGTLQSRDGLWGVCIDPLVKVGQTGRLRIKGPVKARVIDSTSATTALTIGTGCVVVTHNAFAATTGGPRLDVKGYSGTGTTTRKIMGIVLEAATSTPEIESAQYNNTAATSSGTTYGKVLVLFDGINGFGGANGQ